MSEVTDLPKPFFLPAGNSPGSLTITQFERFAENYPLAERVVWRENIFKFIREFRQRTGKDTIAFLDVGCGRGTQLATAVSYAKEQNLHVIADAIDLVSDNIKSTKEKMSDLNVDNSGIVLGDIREHFPDKKYDLVTAFEFIHWLSPDEIGEFFGNVRQHLNDGGQFHISFATILNNALLRDEHGKINVNRCHQKTPIYTYSYPCKTMMTFVDNRFLKNIAFVSSFGPIYYTEEYNNIFPTRPFPEPVPFLKKEDAHAENAFMGFKAIKNSFLRSE